jgi:hypothetical protein
MRKVKVLRGHPSSLTPLPWVGSWSVRVLELCEKTWLLGVVRWFDEPSEDPMNLCEMRDLSVLGLPMRHLAPMRFSVQRPTTDTAPAWRSTSSSVAGLPPSPFAHLTPGARTEDVPYVYVASRADWLAIGYWPLPTTSYARMYMIT